MDNKKTVVLAAGVGALKQNTNGLAAVLKSKKVRPPRRRVPPRLAKIVVS